MSLSLADESPRYAQSYSSIYVEEAAYDYPLTAELLSKYRKSSITKIRHYKDFFNRRGQRWREQKKSQALVLASRRDQFLYPGSSFTPSFGHKNFFYNTLVMNCLYDCDYCYLQGMYPSASTVVFVNLEDYFSATEKQLELSKEVYLSISYDTDLLGFEGLLSYCRRWIEFAASRPELLLEIRTKSANFARIEDLAPLPNVILAWTLSPQSVIDQYEPRTPPLAARLKNVARALQQGWKVRLCVDPILYVEGWRDAYTALLQETAEIQEKPHDISLGVFRMNSRYLSNIQKQRSDSDILFHPFERKEEELSYGESLKEELLSYVEEAAKSYFPDCSVIVQR